MECYSTRLLPAQQKLAFWNDISSATFAPMEVIPANRDEFDGALYRESFGALAFAEVHSSPGIIRHTRSHAARTADAGYILLMPLSGGVAVTTAHCHEMPLQVGDYCLLDHSLPYQLTHSQRSKTFCIGFSTALLQRFMPDPARHTGMRICAASGVPQVSMAMLQSLWNEWQQHRLTDSVVTLAPHIAGLIAEACRQSNPSDNRSGQRRRQIKEFIDSMLQESSLNPAVVAGHFGISTRLLRLIFSAENATPCAYILRRRLECCAEQLVNPAWREHTITDIALRFGFSSSTQFGIAFKRHYGMTPRAYRTTPQPLQH